MSEPAAGLPFLLPVRTMGRLPNQDSAATRERIVAEAIAAFSAEGFSAMTTRRLAQAAGVNVATLSYHFGSKEGLYRACVDAVYTRLSSRGADLLPRVVGTSPEQMMRTLYRMAREEQEGVRLLLREVLDHGRLTAPTQEAHFLPGIEQYASLLMQLPEDWRPRTALHARRAVVSVGFLVSRYATMDEDSLKQALGLSEQAEVEDAVVQALATTAQALVRSP